MTSLATVLDGSGHCPYIALPLITEMSSPFTAANCGYNYNYQLATDVLANDNNQSFIFDCTNTYSSSLPIEPCGYSLTFCIGGHDQQHACSLGECTIIDWSNAHAGECPGPVTRYANTWQTAGLAPACCDGSLCVPPTPKSYNCSSNAIDLWLCVVEVGNSAECVKPIDSSICSTNFTGSVALPSGSVSSSATSTAGTSASGSTGGGQISGSTMTLIIVFSILGGLSTLAGMLAHYRRRRREQLRLQAEARDKIELMDYNSPIATDNNSRTDHVMVNRSNLTDVGRDHNTYHIHGENARIGAWQRCLCRWS